MNRSQSTRPHYFIPKNLHASVPSHSASTTHRIADPAPAPSSHPSSSTSFPLSASAPPSSSASSASGVKPRGPNSTHRIADQGSFTSSTSSRSSTSDRCSYTTSDNRRCRMFCAKDHPELCHHHAQMELRALERGVGKPLAREILGALTDLRSGAALNHALANTFLLSADGRISGSRANSLAYLGQLLLQSLAAIRNDWRGDPAPSAKQALAARLITPLPEPDPATPPGD